jgi:hypothetical protein
MGKDIEKLKKEWLETKYAHDVGALLFVIITVIVLGAMIIFAHSNIVYLMDRTEILEDQVSMIQKKLNSSEWECIEWENTSLIGYEKCYIVNSSEIGLYMNGTPSGILNITNGTGTEMVCFDYGKNFTDVSLINATEVEVPRKKCIKEALVRDKNGGG